MFTATSVYERLKQHPFVPFRIITSAGEHYDILHPELLMVGKNLVIVGTASEENPTQFDRVSQLSILHITALENLSLPSKQTKNGQA